MEKNNKYFFFLIYLCLCFIVGCGRVPMDNRELSVENTSIPFAINSKESQPVEKLNVEDVASVEIYYGNGKFYLSAVQMSKFLSLLQKVQYGKEVESTKLYGDRGNYILHMQDGTKLFYNVIQWEEKGKCDIGHTWYEAKPESVLLQINEMENQMAEEYQKRFTEERYNGLKGNGERSIYYTKFRNRALASCNDEIYGYIKQEMDKLDVAKKMNVHLSNAVTELDNGKILMHFHGSVRYRSTWEFEEISFTLLCDTKEKRVIPYM